MEYREVGDVVITDKMVEAGFRVLCSSGIADSYLGADKTLVAEIFVAMLDASRDVPLDTYRSSSGLAWAKTGGAGAR